jgi:hypothetical protein
VTCTVAASAENFNVLLNLKEDDSATGGPAAQFSLVGTISKTGGTVSITESNRFGGNSGSGVGNDCTLTIAPPHGLVAPGKIWGGFDCPNFRNPSDIGDTGCDLQGLLLFENCSD